MKHFSAFLFCLLFAFSAWAQTFTFSSADSQTIDGVTVSFSKGSGNNDPAYFANGLRLYASNTITVSGTGLTNISIVFAKQGSKAYASLSATPGNLVSGGESTSADDEKTDVWTGNASSVTFTLGASGQRLIKSITVGEGSPVLPGDTTVVIPGDTIVTPPVEEPTLDPSYVYAEPTRVVAPVDSFNNRAYSFIANNIKVDVSKGAIVNGYFGCNAGSTVTFTATRPFKGLAAHAFLKKDFEATASAGTLYTVEASDTVTADPAIVILDINATSLTLSCTKQVRFYAVDFYFEANPDVELDEPIGDYDFSFEPSSPSEFAMAFDSLCFQDDSSNLGYPCTYLYFIGAQHMMDLVVFSAADPLTGLPTGTYPIDATYGSNTVMASPGGDEYMDYPSCIYADFDSEGYYNAAYYLDHGSLVVAGNKYTLDAYTHFGSHVTSVFEGPALNLDEDPETALCQPLADPVAQKILLDGHLVIIRENHHFSPDGRLIR
ncbi:MAG: hypothetical protein KBS77_04755 [Bacteroidales bacterium]|nr:hypothetical protein [Candidatus Colicola faecequi]